MCQSLSGNDILVSGTLYISLYIPDYIHRTISELPLTAHFGLARLYEPLHHKYRPQTFAQLVGQGAIAETLTHALQQNRIAPAYLFCGPRGTGKTSSARILAKSLNCLEADGPTPTPCGKCDVCRSVSSGSALDIVEIDAASNTGVDNIRELIERAQFAPVQCRYKAYVIDECHMLSTAAFNALLKTLEEPPDRVVFVLATTDPQRVLPTIISRCQRFDFRRIPLPAMIKHLGYIAQQEAIEINEAAVQLVAQIAQGGLRDAESLLDQLSLQADEITVEAVWDLVGAVPERDLLNLGKAIAADDSTILIERARNLMDKGREPLIVLQSLVGFYRDLLIAKSAPNRGSMVAITPPTWAEMTEFAQKLSVPQLLASQQKLQTAEVQVKNTTQPRLWLEITLTSLLPSALGAIQVLSASSSPISISDKAVLSVAKPPAIAPVAPPASHTSPQTELQSSAPAETTTPTASASSHSDLSNPARSTEHQTNSSPAPIPTEAAAPPVKEPVDIPTEQQLPANEVPEQSLPTDKVNSDVSFGSLEDLWAKILAALAPRGTQMLMSQQGSMLAFDGVSAKVGFRSAKLQKMAQQRIPNLEKAFEAVFQRPIKVSIEVQQPKEESEPASEQNKGDNKPSSPPSSGSPAPPRPAPPSSPPLSASNSQPTSSASRPAPPANNSPSVPPSPASAQNGTPPRSPNQDNLPSAPSAGSSPDQWATNQDQDNIKRFAQFFNGQIVKLDDDDDLTEDSHNNSATDGPNKRDKKSPDPGPDVPF